jgi:hypothetical protein
MCTEHVSVVCTGLVHTHWLVKETFVNGQKLFATKTFEVPVDYFSPFENRFYSTGPVSEVRLHFEML